MADKKYRLRVDTRKESGGGEYYGEKKYTKPKIAHGVAAALVAAAQDSAFVVVDDNCHIRSTDIVAVWVETIETPGKVGYSR